MKTSGCAFGFQHFPRDLANVNEYKNMFDPHIQLSSVAVQPGQEVIKHFSSSAQLSMKFQLLINVEMSKFVESSGSILNI